jgi:hypothetical protein
MGIISVVSMAKQKCRNFSQNTRILFNKQADFDGKVVFWLKKPAVSIYPL